MPKPMEEPVVAIQLRLYETDLEFLRKYYGPTIGVNNAIRNIIRSYIRHTKAKADELIDLAEAENKGKNDE
jgi:hypothetical protein